MGRSDIRLLTDMVTEACEELAVPVPRWAVTSMILCRPTNSKNGEIRPALSDEILACSANLMMYFREKKPRMVLFIGATVARYYGKEFPEARMIQHPSFVLKMGGRSSTYFTMYMRTIAGTIKSGIKNFRVDS
jgi:uracil-DNA glycosylase